MHKSRAMYAPNESDSTATESDSTYTPQKRKNKEIQGEIELDPKRGYCAKMSVLEAALYDNKVIEYGKVLQNYGIMKEKELEERRRSGCDKFLLNADAIMGIKWVMIGLVPQLLASFITLLAKPIIGFSIYNWILCVAPLIGFYRQNMDDTRATRMNLAKQYLCAVILSYSWATIGPFLIGDSFWNK